MEHANTLQFIFLKEALKKFKFIVQRVLILERRKLGVIMLLFLTVVLEMTFTVTIPKVLRFLFR